MNIVRLFLLLVIINPVIAEGQTTKKEQYLQRGLKLEQSGKYSRALDLWEQAMTKLKTPSLAIGREYIRLVTEHQLKSRYKTASSMYRWGLSAKSVESTRKVLSQELKMLAPLTDKKIYKRWQRLLESNSSQLLEQLHLFWKSQDPTPTTSYNERLLEHWERIAYAREHFDRSTVSVYNTDIRGISWVQYGQPDREYQGNLHLSSARVSTLINTLDPNLAEVQKNALLAATLSLHMSPGYEIWIYRSPTKEMENNLVILFGDTPNGNFQRLNTLEDFIPSRAFSFSNRYKASQIMNREDARQDPNITPGMIMQYIYYEQLAIKDHYFAAVFNKMETEWEGDTRYGQNQALNISAGPVAMLQAKNTMLQIEMKAPDQFSTYEQMIPSIPLKVHQYRLLNERNRPEFVIFLESNPQHVFLNDLAANQDSMFTGKFLSAEQTFRYYKLYHGLQIRNEYGNVISQSRVPTSLVLDSTNTELSSSVFRVPLLSEETKISLYAELHNQHPNSKPQIESLFPPSLRGRGEIQLEQRKPLQVNTSQLQMGDLILGYQMQRSSSDGLFPFVVSNNQEIPVYENIGVHVEVYHLQLGDDGVSRFQLSYEILPINSLGWTQKREQEFSLTLNMEARKTQFAENLEIKASDLKPGRYILRMKAMEEESGRRISREIKFKVVKRSSSGSNK